MEVAQRRVRGPRSAKGVLWRVPPSYQQRLQSEARDHSLSQNAYITATSLVGALLMNGVTSIAAAIGNLLPGMSDAAKDDDVFVGATAEAEWVEIRRFLEALSDANVIPSIKTGRSPGGLVSYGFRFTKDGREVWAALSPILTEILRTDRP